MWHHFNLPILKLSVLTCFKAEVEVSRCFRIDAECIDRPFRVGFSICC